MFFIFFVFIKNKNVSIMDKKNKRRMMSPPHKIQEADQRVTELFLCLSDSFSKNVYIVCTTLLPLLVGYIYIYI